MALRFDGVNDKVNYGDVPGIDGMAALSVLFYINQIVWTSQGAIFCKAASASTLYVLINQLVSTPKIVFNISNGGLSNFGETSAFPVGTTKHAAFVFDGSLSGNSNRMRLYVDGVLTAYDAITGTIPAALDDMLTNPVELGFQGVNSVFGNVEMADVKVYNAALTVDEIVAEKNSYLPQRTRDLILWAPLDDALDAKDYSKAKNVATVSDVPVQITGPVRPYGSRVLAPKRSCRIGSPRRTPTVLGAVPRVLGGV